MRGDLRALGDYLVGGQRDCNPYHRERARAVGTMPVRNAVGVALHHVDILNGAAEALRGDLGERGGMPLAVRVCAAEHRHLTGGMHAYHRVSPACDAPTPLRCEAARRAA